MRAVRYVLAGGVLILATSAAFAQSTNSNGYRYRWKDASGQSNFSDSLTSDALKAGYDVVNSQGVVVQHVNRQLTADERAAAKKVADQQAAAQAAADQRKRDDAQLLNAYPTVEAFTAAQQSHVDNIHQQAETTRFSLQGQEKALADLLNRAGDMERAKQPVPPWLNTRISDQRNIVATLRATLKRQQDTETTARADMASQLEHYRQLRAAADARP